MTPHLRANPTAIFGSAARADEQSATTCFPNTEVAAASCRCWSGVMELAPGATSLVIRTSQDYRYDSLLSMLQFYCHSLWASNLTSVGVYAYYDRSHFLPQSLPETFSSWCTVWLVNDYTKTYQNHNLPFRIGTWANQLGTRKIA